ncbi:MAG: hypothetical protein O7A98_02305, partial [Acidobacteria bacterium]|nr:hypothetical protein [Acidobacteriota bacterium]
MRGRKRGALLLGATMFLAAGSLAAQSWRGAAGLEIRVSSRKKGPVSNAVVELEYRGGPGEVGPPPVATDAKGRALVVGLANGTWQVEVQHPNFMSFVAVVQLDSRGKPQITASFLQASSTQSTPIQVKLLRAKGGTPSPPLRLAARPQPQVVEPVRTPEPRPAAEPKAPEAELDKVPQIAEPTVVAPIREVKAPEPVAPAPEALVPEVPAPETPAPKITAPAKPAPQMAQPEPEAPVAAPEPAPQPPVTEPSPAPGPTPPPVEPEPVQEPPAPQPAPEPLPEPPAIEPEPAET